ncbi:MAG: acetylglutamate kinase [Bryobacteraceae bacterium]
MSAHVLIKIGGTLLDAPESRLRLAREVAAAASGGIEIVVVHGGGKQMTRFLAERGVESRFVNGLRVTTPEVLDAVLKVLAGSVNQELVSAFTVAGARAVGLTGIDALLTEAEPLSDELGAVGWPIRSNAGLLHLLTANGYLPVVACVAGGRDGRMYNVNADQMAAACASGYGAARLFFLTDVEGVRDENGATLAELSIPAMEALIRAGVATGGMQAKLEAGRKALESGVDEVIVAPGARPGIVAQLLAGSPAGTRLHR